MKEPAEAIKKKYTNVIEILDKFSGIYYPDKCSAPPSPTTGVLWNNAGTLYFGSSPIGGGSSFWDDDLTTYLLPTTHGRGIQLDDGTNAEHAYLSRSLTQLVINSGVGGELAIIKQYIEGQKRS